ncbi:hypothetical protein QBC33DRAFT_558433 [Phialemonium atrogriseum]|uniref:Uncharacterized protein n=1 Tax=Phialemonium atrogriseum TaxID=1093897 RepID=A0AAJ0C3Y0_9PEZI|nr:uncharacterized protein QBC33DRAFT_558433 [Phialemonium atrogriseum]KAK1768274.1 hypothetical protein QBC33DRAFT_558433 [Phialemonium atrogriseum]
MATQAAGPRASTNATVMLVIETQKRFYLASIRVADSESGQAVVKRIRAKRDEVTNRIGLSGSLHDVFWEQIINTATVSTFRFVDLEDQSIPLEVIIRTREPFPELTSAYEHPSLLDPRESFVQQYPDLVGASTHKALLVGPKLKEHVILGFSVAGLLIAVAIGVVVGIFTSNVGVGVEAGVTGAIAVLVSLSTWMSK